MKINRTLWARACQVMGREYAAVALALVSTRPAGHFTSGPGGYFAGMLRKFERGRAVPQPHPLEAQGRAVGQGTQSQRTPGLSALPRSVSPEMTRGGRPSPSSRNERRLAEV